MASSVFPIPRLRKSPTPGPRKAQTCAAPDGLQYLAATGEMRIPRPRQIVALADSAATAVI